MTVPTTRFLPHVVALLVFAVALVFRLVMLDLYPAGGPWVADLTLSDAEMGRNLVEGRGWSANGVMLQRAREAQVEQAKMVDLQDLLPVDDADPAALTYVGTPHTPGYSVWFAISYLLGGDYRYVYSQRMQAVADSVAAVLVFLIGRSAWSLTAGAVGGVAYALSPPHAFLGNLTVAAATDSVWFLLVAYGAMVACRESLDGRWPWRGASLAAFGAFCGACMNSTALVLPAVVAGVAALVWLRDRRFGRAALGLAVAQLVVVVVLTPWGFRNQEMYGQFSLVRDTFWQLAFAAWGELPNPWGLGFDDKEYFHWVDENCAGCTSGERQAAMREFLLSEVVPSGPFPRHLYSLLELRIPRLMELARAPRQGVLGTGDGAEQLGATFRLWDRVVPWLAVSALLGFVIGVSRRRDWGILLVGIAPSVFLIVFSLLFYVELRKTVPGYGFLLALAGLPLAAAVEWVVRSGRRRMLGATLAAALVAVTFTSSARAQSAVAGGELHSVAVSDAGQVWGWGSNLYGQLGDGDQVTRYFAALASLASLDDARAVAAGSNHTLAVTGAGEAFAWGDNRWGQLGDGARTGRTVPVQVAGLRQVTQVAGGYVHSLALDAEGTVWAWGNGLYGQLGAGRLRESLRPLPVPLPGPVVAVAAGWFFSVALDEQGRVWTWGRNSRGQLGLGTFDDRDEPALVPGLVGVLEIAAGHQHVLARTEDGVLAWGANDYGQLGIPAALDQEVRRVMAYRDRSAARPQVGSHQEKAVASPTRITASGEPVDQLAAAADVSLVRVSEGAVLSWGDNLYGQLGDGSYTSSWQAVRVQGLPPVAQLAAGHAHALAVTTDGAVWTWGFGHYGQLGDGTTMRRRPHPERVRSVRVRQPLISVAPARDFPIDIGRIDWLDPTFTVVKGHTVDLKGRASEGQRQTYTAVAAPVQAGPNSTYKAFYAQGIVRRGGVTVGVLVDERWAFSQAVPTPGPFTLVWEPPDDITAVGVLANFLTGDGLNVDVEIRSWGWLTSSDAVEGMGAR